MYLCNDAMHSKSKRKSNKYRMRIFLRIKNHLHSNEWNKTIIHTLKLSAKQWKSQWIEISLLKKIFLYKDNHIVSPAAITSIHYSHGENPIYCNLSHNHERCAFSIGDKAIIGILVSFDVSAFDIAFQMRENIFWIANVCGIKSNQRIQMEIDTESHKTIKMTFRNASTVYDSFGFQWRP